MSLRPGRMRQVDAELVQTCAVALGVRADGDSIDRLDAYLQVLETWSRTVRLTGEREMSAVIRKHVIDSFAPAPLLPETGPCLDIGSGAGFPGMVLACVRPDLDFILVEPRRRRANFLRTAIRQVGLARVSVMEARAEGLPASGPLAGGASFVISRALRLDVFLPAAAPLLRVGGTVVAMQTPTVSISQIEVLATRLGLSRTGERDYVLPGGEHRRLVVFRKNSM